MSRNRGYPQGQWPGGGDEESSWAPGNTDEQYNQIETDPLVMAPVSQGMPCGGGEAFKRPAPYSGEDFMDVPDAKRSHFDTGGLPVGGQGQDTEWMYGTIDAADRSRTYFVFNLMLKTTTSDLFKYFIKFGDLAKCEVFTNHEGTTTGTGIVQYVNEEDAMAAFDARPHFIHKKRVILSKDREYDPKTNPDVKWALEKFKLYVADIPLNVSEEDLCEYFSQWGCISFCDVAENAKRTRNAKYGFVSFANYGDAVKCLNTTHSYGKSTIDVFVAANCKALRDVVKEVGDGRGKNHLFVTNIPDDITPEEFTEHFSMWGKLDLCKIAGKVKQNNNFGFAGYQDQEDALTALIMPHTIKNQRVFVQVSDRKSRSLMEASKDPEIMSAIEQKVKNCYLYVPNLNVRTNKDELYEHFKAYGDLASCITRPTGKNELLAFLAFVNETDALRCHQDEHFLNDVKLTVRWSHLTKWGGEDRGVSQKSDDEDAEPARFFRRRRSAGAHRHNRRASPPRHNMSASPPRQARPVSPPKHTGPSRRDRLASPPRHAGSHRHDRLASPPRHAGSHRHDRLASPPRHAGSHRHDRLASPPKHAGPARGVGFPRPAYSGMEPMKAYESPKSVAPAQPTGFARSFIPARPIYPVPPNAAPPSRRLRISGLAAHTAGYMLMCYFSRWGRVEDFDLVTDATLKPTGVAFVIFEKLGDAVKAVSDQPHVIDNKEVEVTYAKPYENLSSQTFPSWRKQTPCETVQHERLPKSVKSLDQGYDAPETREPQRLLEDTQPQRSIEDAQPRRSIEDAQPRRSLKDAQPRMLLEHVQPQRSLEDAQPQRLLKGYQPQKKSTPEALIPSLTQVDTTLSAEYECKVSGCLFKGKSEQFERHWTKIHEAKVLYLICSFCSMECVDADDLGEHLDFFHGIEDRIEMATLLRCAKQQERDNIHFVMPFSVTRETCMKGTQALPSHNQVTPFHPTTTSVPKPVSPPPVLPPMPKPASQPAEGGQSFPPACIQLPVSGILNRSAWQQAPNQSQISAQSQQTCVVASGHTQFGAVAPSVVPPTFPQAGGPLQLPLTGQLITQSADAQPTEFVMEQPPAASQSVIIPSEDPNSIPQLDTQDFDDFDICNIKTQEKENIQEKSCESLSEAEMKTEKKLKDELKRSVHPKKSPSQQRTDSSEPSKKGGRYNSDQLTKECQHRTENRPHSRDKYQNRTQNRDRASENLLQNRGNGDQSRDKHQHGTENHSRYSEDLQQRRSNGDRSRKEHRQRTDNFNRSRDKYEYRTENHGQSSENLQQRTGNGDRSRKGRQQRTDNSDQSKNRYHHRTKNHGQSSEDLQQRTENLGWSREEIRGRRHWNMGKEEPVEVYMDEYMNEGEEYVLAYVDEDGVHVMDDGFVIDEEGHVESEERMDEEREREVRGYAGETRSGHSFIDDKDMQMHDSGQKGLFKDGRFSQEEHLEYGDGNNSVRIGRNENRTQRFEDQMRRESFFVEEDECYDERNECFVEEENEGFTQSERVVEVMNCDELEGAFDTALPESDQQYGRILPGQGNSLDRVSRRLGSSRQVSNQRDSFKARGSQGRGSREHSKSSRGDKSVTRTGKDRNNRGRENIEHDKQFRKHDSKKRGRKDFVNDGTTESQKRRSTEIDDRDNHRSWRNRYWEDKANSYKTKSQYWRKEGDGTKNKHQMNICRKERRHGDKNEGNCEFDEDDGDMADFDMSDFVVMDAV
ncbi:uncharacterized protein [Haliotis asinina]|uniref:uncharacterized protein n=1 Tax=Haliotis asinina TaxID=109174 RepID=UPI003531CBB7